MNTASSAPRRVLRQTALPAALFVGALGIFAYTETQSHHVYLYPRLLLGSIAIIAFLWLAAAAAHEIRDTGIAESPAVSAAASWIAEAAYVTATGLYIAAVSAFGFIVASAAFIVILCVATGYRRYKTLVAVAAAIVGGIYLLFFVYLNLYRIEGWVY